MVCNLCVCVCAWVVKRKEEKSARKRTKRGSKLREKKVIGSFCFSFVLHRFMTMKREEKEKNEKKKEDASSIFLFGERASARAHTLSVVAKCETHTHTEWVKVVRS